MPTQEERLTALEQTLATSQQETDENITIMLGVIRHQGQDIRRIVQHLATMDERLDRLETKLDEHTRLLTQILARLPGNP